MKNKLTLVVVALLCAQFTNAQFASSSSNWSTPQGGTITSNTLIGYNSTFGVAYNGLTTGSETWALIDMNGDNKPDLVVTGSLVSNNNTQFSATSNPFWKVFLNTGSGFSGTATNWSTPQGGNITSNTLFGYNSISGTAASGQTNGSESWNLNDMNGDNMPDLVVTGSLSNNLNTQFSATSSPFWKVFLNTGSGFSGTATNWTTPQGGTITNNTLIGYNLGAGVAYNGLTQGSETWSLLDMNGDNKPDLVVTGSLVNNVNTQFNATSSPSWNVYVNSGTGFATSVAAWSTPQGGLISSNTLYGYNSVSGVAASNQTNGSETWSLTDMNGDNKPDLVVTGSLASGNNTQFNATNNPFWKVFLNNGGGFAGSASNWTTPQGGTIASNTLIGYNNTGGIAFNGLTAGAETWSLVDINGDNRPELVVTGSLSNNNNIQFNATNNPFWKVFSNSGSGFSTSASNWSTPQGGTIAGNTLWGYNNLYGTAAAGQNDNSETWSVIDMNGDNAPELVLTGSWTSSKNTQFSATSNPFWKVFANNGVSGVEDGVLEIATNLYPNPTTGNFTLDFADNVTREIEITNALGATIIAPVKVESQMQFNLNHAPAGIYFLQIKQSGKLKTVRFSLVR